MHASIFNAALLHLNQSEFYIMTDQFRIPMQHLKLHKMEATFKALWKVLMLMIKSPFLWATLGYNVPGCYTLKCWSLSIMDFELASIPKKW